MPEYRSKVPTTICFGGPAKVARILHVGKAMTGMLVSAFSRIETLFVLKLAAAKSAWLSPLKSPTATDTGNVPTVPTVSDLPNVRDIEGDGEVPGSVAQTDRGVP